MYKYFILCKRALQDNLAFCEKPLENLPISPSSGPTLHALCTLFTPKLPESILWTSIFTREARSIVKPIGVARIQL